MLVLVFVDSYGTDLSVQFLHGKDAMFYGKRLLRTNPNCKTLKLINLATGENLHTWR
jgi:hypothetical protein